MANLPNTYTRAYAKALAASKALDKARKLNFSPMMLKNAVGTLEEAKAALAKVQANMRSPK